MLETLKEMIDPKYLRESTTHIIFTDGSGKNNGGWAAVIVELGAGVREMSGSGSGFVKPTNNQMEMLAAIKALESLADEERHDSYEILIVTDSTYLAHNLNLVPGWRERGWMTYGYPEKGIDPKPVANQDLWERLTELADVMQVQIIHSKRDTHPLNTRADQLADEAAIETGESAGPRSS